jgi:hypothetical protein
MKFDSKHAALAVGLVIVAEVIKAVVRETVVYFSEPVDQAISAAIVLAAVSFYFWRTQQRPPRQ